MLGVIVRRATPADVEALVDVQQEGAILALAHIFPQDLHPFPRADVVRRWQHEVRDAETHTYVSVDEAGDVSGFAATRGSELLHFGTRVDTWGSGLAQALHDAVLSELAGTAPAGTTRAWLRVFEGNLRAQRFYERLGWVATGERSRTSFPPHPVLLHYERPLPP